MDLAQVRQGRAGGDELHVKTLEDATSKAGKVPNTTKWIDRVKQDDDGRLFVRCRLVACGFTPRGEGFRDDLFAAMPTLGHGYRLMHFSTFTCR